MSITVKSNPANLSSAHSDLLFVVYEATKANDPVTYPDYRYIADIYVGSTMVTRIKKVPQPDTKMGVFNIGQVVRDYLSAVFNPAAGTLQAQNLGSGLFNFKATVKFGEEYDFNTYTNLTVDSERTYYSHYNGRLSGGTSLLTGFVNTGTGATKMLTHRPDATPVNRDDAYAFLPYWAYLSAAYNISIKSYTPGGTLLNTLSYNLTPAAANTIELLNVSPAIITGLSAAFFNGAGYYTVTIGANTFRFDLICEPRYQVYTLHFLNQFGGFESRNFTKVSRKSLAITKAEYNRLPYQVDASGNVSYFNSNKVYHETNSTYSSQYSEKLTVNSDIMTDAEYIWISELVLSPLVYVEMDGYFIPCSIKENNYDFKKAVNDKLTNLSISIEFGDQFNAQYR